MCNGTVPVSTINEAPRSSQSSPWPQHRPATINRSSAGGKFPKPKGSQPRHVALGSLARKLCLASLALAWITSLTCIAISILILVKGQTSTSFDVSGWEEREYFPPGDWYVGTGRYLYWGASLVSVSVTALLSEALGVTHSTALRWKLWKEDRLEWNTNLRILPRSRISRPFKWDAALLYDLALVFPYTSASQTFLRREIDYGSTDTITTLNGLATLFLGVAMLTQTSITTWAWWTTRKVVKTFDTSILVTMHASMLDGHRHPDFFTVGTLLPHARKPIRPSWKQPALYQCNPLTKKVLVLLWVTFALSTMWLVIWFAIFSYTRGSNNKHPDNTSFSFVYSADFINVFNASMEPPALSVHFVSLLITAAIQAIATFAVHLTEQITSAVQDELVWREAATRRGCPSRRGAPYSTNALTLMWRMPPTLCLYVLTALLNWVFGLTLSNDGASFSVNHASWPLIALCALSLLLAIFATALASWKPKGPQPATYGHIRTLVSLIDDWGEEGGRLYWGDKGYLVHDGHNEDESDGEACRFRPRRAGTSSRREALGGIVMDGVYN